MAKHLYTSETASEGGNALLESLESLVSGFDANGDSLGHIEEMGGS